MGYHDSSFFVSAKCPRSHDCIARVVGLAIPSGHKKSEAKTDKVFASLF